MIEAQNKPFKYRYLFRQEYSTGEDLRRVFAEDLYDYNIRRPHVSLKGYTPGEAYSGLSDMEMKWSDQIRQARRDRLAVNRMETCSLCQEILRDNWKKHRNNRYSVTWLETLLLNILIYKALLSFVAILQQIIPILP
jgi:hypothetical protein